jgi:hypothetical protein
MYAKREKEEKEIRRNLSPCKVEKREALVKTRSTQLEKLELAPTKRTSPSHAGEKRGREETKSIQEEAKTLKREREKRRDSKKR